jgi:outer membrane protein TolC
MHSGRNLIFLRHGDWFDIAAVTLNVNIPIFTGFAQNARIQKARLELQQGVNERENLKLSIDHDIQVAKNNFRTSISTLDFQKKNMDLAEEVFRQTERKYAAGTGSQTEINTAQTELKNAQTNYITALYEAVIAKVDFLKSTGKL